MYIAICDDQESELNIVTDLLQKWQKDRSIPLQYKIFRSAAELLDTAKSEPFNLYLLDVMMPGTDGIAAAREIRLLDETAEIVFLTTSPGFAYESYSVHALDYLLKPLHAERLFPILDQLFFREQKPEEGISIKCGITLTRILFSRLSHVEVIGRYIYFNMADGSSHKISGTLKEYAPILLARPEFIQIHRSYILNMFQAAEISPGGARTFSGKNLPISRLLYPEVQKRYVQLLFEKEDA